MVSLAYVKHYESMHPLACVSRWCSQTIAIDIEAEQEARHQMLLTARPDTRRELAIWSRLFSRKQATSMQPIKP